MHRLWSKMTSDGSPHNQLCLASIACVFEMPNAPTKVFDAGLRASLHRTPEHWEHFNAGRTLRGDCPSSRPMHRTASDNLPTKIFAAKSHDDDQAWVLNQCAAFLVTPGPVRRSCGSYTFAVACKALVYGRAAAPISTS